MPVRLCLPVFIFLLLLLSPRVKLPLLPMSTRILYTEKFPCTERHRLWGLSHPDTAINKKTNSISLLPVWQLTVAAMHHVHKAQTEGLRFYRNIRDKWQLTGKKGNKLDLLRFKIQLLDKSPRLFPGCNVEVWPCKKKKESTGWKPWLRERKKKSKVLKLSRNTTNMLAFFFYFYFSDNEVCILY